MAFVPCKVDEPPIRRDPEDPRFLELRTADVAKADVLLCGVPYDGAVIGRKGAAGGPKGIREAFRFLASHDPATGDDLAGLRWHDLGDVAAPEELAKQVPLHAHRLVREVVESVFTAATTAGKPLIVLGGDNSLSFPIIQALCQAHGAPKGSVGVVVLDAHYDVRTWNPDHGGQPSSGTPYGRVLEELPGQPVLGTNVAEIGIRAYANTSHLARRAQALGIQVHTLDAVRTMGVGQVAEQAVGRATAGTQRFWLSVDLDVLHQSQAPGVSAPGIDGMSLDQAAAAVRLAAFNPRCAGIDLVECAPVLDPSGNTTRSAAYLVAAFMGGVSARQGQTH